MSRTESKLWAHQCPFTVMNMDALSCCPAALNGPVTKECKEEMDMMWFILKCVGSLH